MLTTTATRKGTAPASSRAGRVRHWLSRLRKDELLWLYSRKASGALVVDGASNAARFLALIPVARVFGAASYGVYVYVAAWLDLAVLVAAMGLPGATQRFIPEYLAKREWSHCRGFWLWARRRAVENSAALALGVAVALWAFWDKLPRELGWTALLACAALPLLVLAIVQQAAALGLKRTVEAKSLYGFGLPAVLLGMVLLAWLGLAPRHASALMGARGLGSLAVAAVLYAWLNRWLPREVQSAPLAAERELWREVALSMLLVNALALVMNQADTLMVGAMLGTTDAGIYRTASMLAMLPAMSLAASNAIMAPLISELYARGEIEELQRVVTFAARATFGLIAASSLGLVMLGHWILRWFGSEFGAGYAPLVVLAVGQAVNGFCGPVGLLLMLTGSHRLVTAVFGVTACANVVLNARLIPLLGAAGAGLATGASTALWNVLLTLAVCRRLGIWPLPTGRWRRGPRGFPGRRLR